jgi:hypothetical protein
VVVIGGTASEDERSVQYEGVADEPHGAELDRLKPLYFDYGVRSSPASRKR